VCRNLNSEAQVGGVGKLGKVTDGGDGALGFEDGLGELE
jgi:hypothetical protein